MENVLLSMHLFRYNRGNVPDGFVAWKIRGPRRGADETRFVFPNDERIVALWEENFLGKEKTVTMVNNVSTHIMVFIPKGTKPRHRQPFLDALMAETAPFET